MHRMNLTHSVQLMYFDLGQFNVAECRTWCRLQNKWIKQQNKLQTTVDSTCDWHFYRFQWQNLKSIKIQRRVQRTSFTERHTQQWHEHEKLYQIGIHEKRRILIWSLVSLFVYREQKGEKPKKKRQMLPSQLRKQDIWYATQSMYLFVTVFHRQSSFYNYCPAFHRRHSIARNPYTLKCMFQTHTHPHIRSRSFRFDSRVFFCAAFIALMLYTTHVCIVCTMFTRPPFSFVLNIFFRINFFHTFYLFSSIMSHHS